MTAFWASLIFVVLAEMGDKTQLLAMAFACRYRWQTVIWAVFWATALNHFFAAAAGNYLASVVPIVCIKISAAASFIVFGLWTIRGDTLHGEDKRFNFSPFWTVAVAFFIAEMGDKTQLATIALAVQYNTVLSVWMGTTLGMLISNAIGITIGIMMGKKIPERFIKWFAALIFIAFGIYGLYENLPAHFFNFPSITGGLILLILLIYLFDRSNRTTAIPSCRKD
ncbi:MAG: TMEM165/GDT1 family protein [Nitrospiraceae bacterium]|nr:MAG: TMEM165/GDT1 family protein [Nitrospiraceae bacterium]